MYRKKIDIVCLPKDKVEKGKLGRHKLLYWGKDEKNEIKY